MRGKPAVFPLFVGSLHRYRRGFFFSSIGSTRTTQCIPTTQTLGQGTFPYYALDSIINHGAFDTDSSVSNVQDPITFSRTLTLSDGTKLILDDEEGVGYKVGLARDLCLGGVGRTFRFLFLSYSIGG